MFTVKFIKKDTKRPYNISYFKHKSPSVGNLIKTYSLSQAYQSQPIACKVLTHTDVQGQPITNQNPLKSEDKNNKKTIQLNMQMPFIVTELSIAENEKGNNQFPQIDYISSFLNINDHQPEYDSPPFNANIQNDMSEEDIKKIQDSHQYHLQYVHRNESNNKSSMKTQTIKKNQQLWKCHCGNKYKSFSRLELHKKSKHFQKSQNIISSQIKTLSHQKALQALMKVKFDSNISKYRLKKTVKISINWQQRIIQCLNELKLSNNQFLQLQQFLCSQSNNLNIQIFAYRILSSFIKSQQQQPPKLAIKLFKNKLQQFLQQNDEIYKIWVLDFFDSMHLIISSFYQWLNQYKMKQILNISYQMLSQFVINMYIIFNNWAYQHQYTNVLIMDNSI